MADKILYQSVLQKLGQLDPKDLSQLDAFLSVLIGHKMPKKSKKSPLSADKSPIYWLEQLAQIGGVSTIDDPVEWQRSIRQDRKLPYR